MWFTVLHEQVGTFLMAVPVNRSTNDRLGVGQVLDDRLQTLVHTGLQPHWITRIRLIRVRDQCRESSRLLSRTLLELARHEDPASTGGGVRWGWLVERWQRRNGIKVDVLEDVRLSSNQRGQVSVELGVGENERGVVDGRHQEGEENHFVEHGEFL